METELAVPRTGLHGAARVFWVAAFGWAALFSVLAGLFASGYAMDDPGGLAGLGLVVAIFAPMLLGSLFVWKAPDAAYPVLIVVAALAVVFGIWQLVDPITLRDFEDENGPVSAIGSFITMMPVALLARRHAWPAVVIMLVLAIAGMLPEFRTHFHLGSSMAVALPMLLEAVLLALAAALAPRA
ncbi:MAG: hypothetical protein ACR2J9_12855 [Gaiellales bacterium]